MLDNHSTLNKQTHLHDAITRSAIIAHYLDEYLQAYVSCDKTAYKAVHGKVVRIFDQNEEALDFFLDLNKQLQKPLDKLPKWLKERIKTIPPEKEKSPASSKETRESPNVKIQNEVGKLISEGFELIRLPQGKKTPYKGSKGVHDTYSPQEFKRGDNIGIKTGTD